MNLCLNKTIRKVNPHQLFLSCKYEKHNAGYIRNDEFGRFHLLQKNKDVWQLHYDINVEWRHVSIDMPYRCGSEIKIILKKMYKKYGFKKIKDGNIVPAEDFKFIVKRHDSPRI